MTAAEDRPAALDGSALLREARPTLSGQRTTLALVRHGQTVWHAENRYAGTSDIDLTDVGMQQARQLAQWCTDKHFDAIVSSPIRRAVETARLSAAVLGLPLTVVDDLREVDFGLAEGRTAAELLDLDADMVHRFRDDPVAHPFPGAESPEAAARRGAAALRSIAALHAGGAVLVIAHNTLLRLGICLLLDLPVSEYRRYFPRLDNAAISELSVPVNPAEPSSLLSLNVHPSTA
jgi:2,3-bisphosphoglycerate-dependent phosphoglycerate mutase